MGGLEEARKRLEEARKVAVLTGAGISKPSGIPTFRDAEGLWKEFNPLEYATPEAYAKDPEKVWAWYAWRIAKVREARPNPAHQALAELERRVLERGGEFLLVTQNVDGLHARAGSRNLVELHGNILRARCEACGHRFPLPEAFTPPPSCPRCGHRARPDVVWFGEFLPEGAWEWAVRAFSQADVALVIGTSAEVEPAASLGRIAYASGAYLVEVNPEPTPLTPLAHLSLRHGGGGGDGGPSGRAMSGFFRCLADLATLARAGVVGWVLLQVGEGPEALGQVVRLLLLGWSLDILDGILARASGRPSPLAAWDYPLDAGLAWAGWAYLAGAGLLAPGVAWGWAVLALVLLLRRPKKSLSMALQVPPTFAPFFLAQSLALEAFREALVWVLGVLLLDGRRFIGVVQEFLEDAGLFALFARRRA
jgi:NAD-dependent deacetylase